MAASNFDRQTSTEIKPVQKIIINSKFNLRLKLKFRIMIRIGISEDTYRNLY